MSYRVGEDDAGDREIDRLRKRGPTAAHHALWAEVGLKPGQRALDVGCGPGLFSLELASRVGPGGSVIGVDHSPKMLEEAAKEARSRRIENVTFARGDCLALGVESKSIDFAWIRLVLQHLEAPVDALREVRRALKEGGRVCIVDADRDFVVFYPEPAEWRRLYPKMIDEQAKRGGDPRVGRKLATYLVEAGFDAVEVAMSNDILQGKQLEAFAQGTLTSMAEQYLSEPVERASLIEAVAAEASNLKTRMYHTMFVAHATRPLSG